MATKDEEKEENLSMAMLAEMAERYDDMMEAMEKVATAFSMDHLNDGERSLLSVACKSVIEARRVSRRTVSSIERKGKGKGNVDTDHLAIIETFRATIEDEMSSICERIFNLLDNHLIPTSTTAEAKVFCLKMKGDYHRYLAEFKDGAKEPAESAYKLAQEIATTELARTHPLRLGLALNFSVFYYQIMNDPESANMVAKDALNGAILALDKLGDQSWKENTVSRIMKILRHNIIRCNCISNMQPPDDDVLSCSKDSMFEDAEDVDVDSVKGPSCAKSSGNTVSGKRGSVAPSI